MRTAALVLLLVAACTSESSSIVVRCQELSLEACNDYAYCKVDFCPTCSCKPSSSVCRFANDPPLECPPIDCPVPPRCCTQDFDCSGATCEPPGATPSCGNCNPAPGDCFADTECAPSDVCEPISCSCDGQKRCVPGCSASGAPCPEGTTCDGVTGRCETLTCAQGCPPLYTCASSFVCERRTCDFEFACPGGFCVEGLCYDALGECRVPAP